MATLELKSKGISCLPTMQPYHDSLMDVAKALDYSLVPAEGQGGFVMLSHRGETLLGALCIDHHGSHIKLLIRQAGRINRRDYSVRGEICHFPDWQQRSGAAKALWTQQGDDVIVVPSSERQVCGMKRRPKRKISDQNQDLRLGI